MSGSISNQLSSVAQKIATAETEIEEVKTEIEKVKTDIEEVKTKIATAETEIEAVKAQLSVVDQQLCASGLPDEEKNSLVEEQRYFRKRISELGKEKNQLLKRISEDLGKEKNHLRVKENRLLDQLKDLQQVAEGVSGSLFDLNLERTYVCCVTLAFATVVLNHVFHRIQLQIIIPVLGKEGR
jgi:chromosome segregation ATPase